jgi:hypothetical protein
MTSSAIQFAQLLRRFAKLIEQRSLDEVEQVLLALEGSTSLPARPREASPQRRPKTANPSLGTDEIMRRLAEAPNREAGASLLRELNLSKRELLDVARHRSVHIMKDDSLRRIEEKLVEAFIGSKLNSLAIRGSSDEKLTE